MAIQWGNSILNDSLYLGVKNGAVQMIIPTGAELPYTSPVMYGFRIERGQNRIAVPIKNQNIDGTYRTIATGNISFRQNYPEGAFVAFVVHMGNNKIITMRAWTSKDDKGKWKLEQGYVEIAIDNGEKSRVRTKFVPPDGLKLNPKAEINNLLQLCQNYEKCRGKSEKSSLAKRISECVGSICNAGNKEDFPDALLDTLKGVSNEEARQRLFVIARRIGKNWDESKKQRLAAACMSQISADLHGMVAVGSRVSTNIQAVYTLSMCADFEQLSRLSALHTSTRYLQACLYVHAKTRTDLEWLCGEFEKDVKLVQNNMGSNIQFSAYAVGVALRKDGQDILSEKAQERIVKALSDAIRSRRLTAEELTCCMLALGWICDRRQQGMKISGQVIGEALNTLQNLEGEYKAFVIAKCIKPREVAMKMMNGEFLNEDEERFLLIKLEI